MNFIIRGGVFGLLLAAGACASDSVPGTPSAVAPIRVLMLTATEGFRHDSIGTARDVMASLNGYDVLLFAMTSGELPFTNDQKTAIVNFVNGGRGFLGVHSASDTLYEWPEYGRFVGAYYQHHPWTQQATVIVEDQSHPATRDLGDRFRSWTSSTRFARTRVS